MENKSSLSSIKMQAVDSQKSLENPYDKENSVLKPYLDKKYKNVEDYVHTKKTKNITHQIIKEVDSVTYNTGLRSRSEQVVSNSLTFIRYIDRTN